MKRLINAVSPIIGLLILGLFTITLVSTFQKPTGFDSPNTGFTSVSPATPTPYYTPFAEIPPITPIPTSEILPIPWPSPTPLSSITSEKRPGLWTENLLLGSPQPFAKGLKDPFVKFSGHQMAANWRLASLQGNLFGMIWGSLRGNSLGLP